MPKRCARRLRGGYGAGTALTLVAALTVGSCSSSKDGVPPADPTGVPSTWIYPGQDWQARVDAHPPGTEFIIQPGVHRLQSVRAKAGNVFTGEPGAVLSGARQLTQFTREAGLWVAGEQRQENRRYGPNQFGDEVCDDERPACIFPEDVFLDDEPLRQVTDRSLVEPGTWFFDYAADKVYLADDPSGHSIEISVAPYAIFGEPADRLVVRGLIIEKYANAAQLPALGAFNSDDVVFENNEVRLNHGIGIGISSGRRGRIVGNAVHHQGQLGIGSFGVTELLVEGNEIAFNNHADYSVHWEAGGAKFTRMRDLTVRGNHVHHNNGPGLWSDLDNMTTLYEHNEVVENTRPGIWHEISYDAVIRYNTVIGNLVGIGVAHSPNVEVYGNVVRDNEEGIIGLQQDRGSGVFGPHETDNLFVHDNEITMAEGGTGVIQQVGDDTYFTSRNNRFERNTYLLGPTGNYFYWMNRVLSVQEWQAFGQDVEGVFGRR